MLSSVIVFCCVCGQAHRAGDAPATVLYRSEDSRWWCADETACWLRARIAEQDEQQRLADIAAMYKALQSTWADLEQDGWFL